MRVTVVESSISLIVSFTCPLAEYHKLVEHTIDFGVVRAALARATDKLFGGFLAAHDHERRRKSGQGQCPVRQEVALHATTRNASPGRKPSRRPSAIRDRAVVLTPAGADAIVPRQTVSRTACEGHARRARLRSARTKHHQRTDDVRIARRRAWTAARHSRATATPVTMMRPERRSLKPAPI